MSSDDLEQQLRAIADGQKAVLDALLSPVLAEYDSQGRIVSAQRRKPPEKMALTQPAAARAQHNSPAARTQPIEARREKAGGVATAPDELNSLEAFEKSFEQAEGRGDIQAMKVLLFDDKAREARYKELREHARDNVREFFEGQLNKPDGQTAVMYQNGTHWALQKILRAVIAASNENRLIDSGVARIHKQRILQLEKRIEALETQQKGFEYRGVWSENETYHPNEFVTHGGSMWACKQVVAGHRPGGDSAAWQLAVKRGAAAR